MHSETTFEVVFLVDRRGQELQAVDALVCTLEIVTLIRLLRRPLVLVFVLAAAEWHKSS